MIKGERDDGMNFDTKHLVRWGIPGWIMIIALTPYLYFSIDELKEVREMLNSLNLVAVGAFLTVTGVPLGYLLNQIHHSLTWVIPRYFSNGWNKYFNQEIKVDEVFVTEEHGEKLQERYRYLLSRKHELGGVATSLGISSLIIFIIIIFQPINQFWSWIYFCIVLLLFLIILISRNYSSRNVEKYFDYYLKKNK